MRLDVALAKRDAGGSVSLLLEVGRLEPFTLFGRIDSGQVVSSRRQAADLESAILVGTASRDLAGERPPQVGIGGKRQHRVVGDGHRLFVRDRPVDFGLPAGQYDRHVAQLLIAADLDRLVDHLMAVDNHRFERPAAKPSRTNPMRPGRHTFQGETTVLLDASVRVRTDRGILGRRRGNSDLRQIRKVGSVHCDRSTDCGARIEDN